MKLDKTLLVNTFVSFILTVAVYFVFQLTGGVFQEDNIVILFFLFLIFLELERKKR
jgi:hypothetical protein